MADDIPAVEGVEHRFVDANGIRIHVAEAGPADAPAVLLLHGWPAALVHVAPGDGRPRPVSTGSWRPTCAGSAGPRRRAMATTARRSQPTRWRCSTRSGSSEHTSWDTTGAAGRRCCSGSCTRIGSIAWWSATLRTRGRGSRPGVAIESWRAWYTWVIATPGLGRLVLERPWIARRILGGGNVGTPFTEEELHLYVRQLSGAASGGRDREALSLLPAGRARGRARPLAP